MWTRLITAVFIGLIVSTSLPARAADHGLNEEKEEIWKKLEEEIKK